MRSARDDHLITGSVFIVRLSPPLHTYLTALQRGLVENFVHVYSNVVIASLIKLLSQLSPN